MLRLKRSLSMSVLAFLTCSLSWAQKTTVNQEVAIDPTSGDTFILKLDSNPSGRIEFRNKRDHIKDHFALSDPGADSMRYHIQLSKPGLLSYSIQTGNTWFVDGYQKDGNFWVLMPGGAGLSGTGNLKAMSSVPDGNLVLTIEENGTTEVVLVEPGYHYRRLEKIPEQRILEEAQALTKSSPVADKDAPGVSIGTEDPSEDDSSNAFGLAAGRVSGLGLAYQRFLTKSQALRFVALPFGNSDHVALNLGVNYLLDLRRERWFRAYLIAGASVFYSRQKTTTYAPGSPACTDPTRCIPSQGTTTTSWDSSETYNFGVGPGFEARGKAVGIAFEWPALQMSFSNDSQGFHFSDFYPIPGIALTVYLPKKH